MQGSWDYKETEAQRRPVPQDEFGHHIMAESVSIYLNIYYRQVVSVLDVSFLSFRLYWLLQRYSVGTCFDLRHHFFLFFSIKLRIGHHILSSRVLLLPLLDLLYLPRLLTTLRFLQATDTLRLIHRCGVAYQM